MREGQKCGEEGLSKFFTKNNFSGVFQRIKSFIYIGAIMLALQENDRINKPYIWNKRPSLICKPASPDMKNFRHAALR